MTHCLNCTQPLTASYCAYCGQKASTHRYSVKHFVAHDLVHGVLHVDKGILFTVKELFTRPGHSIRAFIEGKRTGYFSFITLLLILIGIGHFLGKLSPLTLTEIVPENTKAVMSVVEQLTTKYPKLVPLMMIPLASFFSFVWFRKARLNFTEHLVLNAYKACGEMIIGLLFSILIIFYHDKEVLYSLYNMIGLVAMLYGVWFYYQYFSLTGYKKWSLLLRCIMIPVSITLTYIAIGFVAAVLTYKQV